MILLGVFFLSCRFVCWGLLLDWLSLVVFCYVIGIFFKNISFFLFSDLFLIIVMEVGILFVILFLFYVIDLKWWLFYVGSSVLSFGLCVLSGVVVMVVVVYWFLNDLLDIWWLVGMFVGIYIGGIFNM